MSLTLSYANTPTTPVTEREFAPDPLNFGADYRVLREGANEVVLTNISAPLNDPETIRVAFTEIADVFKGTSVEPTSSAIPDNVAMKRGCSLLVQMNGVGADTNGARFPYSAHLVLKVPYGPDPEAADIEKILQRLIGTLYSTGDEEMTSRVDSLLRGALAPSEL